MTATAWSQHRSATDATLRWVANLRKKSVVDSMLHIVTVSFVDDNFGDNLIRTTFQALLEVALENYGAQAGEFEISRMALKAVDEELLERADIIFFAGGGLFGLSYLGFYPHVDQITAIASRRGIPVVFSSMGTNNMGAAGGSVASIAEILGRDCVRRISVREDLGLFQEAAKDTELSVTKVADPAVWTKFVYGMTDVEPDGTLGINVVRGGLFVANDRQWGLTAEMDYMTGIRNLAETAGISAQFYTNGSLDDNNTLRLFAQERHVPSREIVLPQTTRDVVTAIASRSMIAAIRMHSSIIAYSFGIPTIALAWNDKLDHFYEAIGHTERLMPFGEWSADRSFAALERAVKEPQSDDEYRAYLMSTYEYIHAAVGEQIMGRGVEIGSRYSFDEVADALTRRAESIDETEYDLRVKMGKTERAYLKRFVTLRAKDKEIRELRQANDARAAEVREKDARIADLEERLERRNRALEVADEAMKARDADVAAHGLDLQHLNARVDAVEKQLAGMGRVDFREASPNDAS